MSSDEPNSIFLACMKMIGLFVAGFFLLPPVWWAFKVWDHFWSYP